MNKGPIQHEPTNDCNGNGKDGGAIRERVHEFMEKKIPQTSKN